MRSIDTINEKSNTIEAWLRDRGMALRVDGGRVMPRTVQLRLAGSPFGPSLRDHLNASAEEIAVALGVPRIAVYSDSRTRALYVEFPRPDAKFLDLWPLYRKVQEQYPIPPLTALLGLDTDDGAPTLLRLNNWLAHHVLIAGAVGIGKTALARTIALSLAASNSPESLRLKAVGDVLYTLPHLDHLVQDWPTALVAVARGAHLAAILDDWNGEDHRWLRMLESGNDRVHLIAVTSNVDMVSQWREVFPTHILGCGAEPAGYAPLLAAGDFYIRSPRGTTRLTAAWVDPGGSVPQTTDAAPALLERGQ